MNVYKLKEKELALLTRWSTALEVARDHAAAMETRMMSYIVSNIAPKMGVKGVAGTATPFDLDIKKGEVSVGLTEVKSQIVTPNGLVRK